jgi:hypothetical protein
MFINFLKEILCMDEQNEIIKILGDLKQKTSNAAIYLVALLFAIELHSLWLVITFSSLISIIFLIKVIKIIKKRKQNYINCNKP